MSSRLGLRALVTRPRAEAQGLAQALAERGIEAIIEPLLDIHYRDGATPDLAGVQAILCTSANGVRAFARLSSERGVPLFAVGDATAARAQLEGFTRVESAGGNVDDLARLVRNRLRSGDGRLLHIAGTEIAGDLAGILRNHAFEVVRAVLYEARPVAALSAPAARALSAGIIDFVLFFSPRTAATFLSLAERAEVTEALRTVTAVSISAAAHAALASAVFRERRIAEAPTQAAVLSALDRILAEPQRA